MSHVFQRGAAYYTPTTGVVDVPSGQRIAESAAGVWKSPCGTLVVDGDSVARWVSDGIVGPLSPAAIAELAAAQAREAAEEAADADAHSSDDGVEQEGGKPPPEEGAEGTGAGDGDAATDQGASQDLPAKPAPKPAGKPGRGGRRG